MKSVIDELCKEHRNIEQVLRVITARLEPCELMNPKLCMFLYGAIAYLGEYERNVHHRKEDVLTSHLLWLDRTLHQVHGQLLEQRRFLTDREAGILCHLRVARRDDPQSCTRLKKLIAAYAEAYRNYIAVEEGVLYRAVLDSSAHQHWPEAGRGFLQVMDPVFGLEASRRYASCEDALTAYPIASAS